MTALTIRLQDEEARRLRTLAEEAGVSPEDLAAEAVRKRIAHEEPTDEFEAAARRVMEKNAELYRRLA